ncbi:MAG: HAMP domain-containing protein [Nitrospirae bacterium]|nr:MAG: HAMP domain-containing protein [Nitrospirota bacterium]
MGRAGPGSEVPWYRGIAFKVSAVTAAVVVATVAVAGFVVLASLHRYGEAVLASRGRYIATTLAQQAVEPILYEDRVALLRLVESFQPGAEGSPGEAAIVAYAEIRDRNGRPLVGIGPIPQEAHPEPPRPGPPAVRDGGGLVFEVRAPVVVKGVAIGGVRVGITRAGVRARERQLALQTGLLLAVAGLAAASLAVLLARRFIRPLRRVIAGARRIGEGGWGTRIHVAARDETGQLAATFNEMSARLKEAFDEVQRTQAQLIQSERLSTLGRFAAHLAHELKNPLTSIKLSMQAMAESGDGCLDAEERELILDDVAHMDEVITSFLAYGRRRPPQPVAVDAAAFLEEVGRRLAARARQSGVAVELDLAPDLGEVALDPEALAEALENVVTNAVQVSERGASVRLSAAPHPEGVRIEVADQGPGMGPEVQAHLFEPFYTTRHGGTGLGLAIAQQVVTDHGGRIEVESAPGAGTVVAIVLPRRGPVAVEEG